MSFNRLPIELFLLITDYLSSSDLVSLSKTSQQLQDAVWFCLRSQDFFSFLICAAEDVTGPAITGEFGLACAVYYHYSHIVPDPFYCTDRRWRKEVGMTLFRLLAHDITDMSRSDLRECLEGWRRYLTSQRTPPTPLWRALIPWVVPWVVLLMFLWGLRFLTEALDSYKNN
jgi:hypothetical protein